MIFFRALVLEENGEMFAEKFITQGETDEKFIRNDFYWLTSFNSTC